MVVLHISKTHECTTSNPILTLRFLGARLFWLGLQYICWRTKHITISEQFFLWRISRLGPYLKLLQASVMLCNPVVYPEGVVHGHNTQFRWHSNFRALHISMYENGLLHLYHNIDINFVCPIMMRSPQTTESNVFYLT